MAHAEDESVGRSRKYGNEIPPTIKEDQRKKTDEEFASDLLEVFSLLPHEASPPTTPSRDNIGYYDDDGMSSDTETAPREEKDDFVEVDETDSTPQASASERQQQPQSALSPIKLSINTRIHLDTSYSLIPIPVSSPVDSATLITGKVLETLP